MVDAGGCALKLIDGAKLRNRPRQRVDARRKWTGNGRRELPGREGGDIVVGAEEICAGGVVYRV